MSNHKVVSVHWSFRMIGGVGLIFNLLGCVNFLSQMNAETVASMPETYRTIVESRSVWGTAAVALAVFGGLLGCVLLLLRKSSALHVFVVSVIGAFATQVPFVGMTGFPVDAWVGWLSPVAVGVFLVWYSRVSRSKGWSAGRAMTENDKALPRVVRFPPGLRANNRLPVLRALGVDRCRGNLSDLCRQV